ncbi:MAG: MmgE/PrpD family protein [Candidatus Limnocylindrales bacterium]
MSDLATSRPDATTARTAPDRASNDAIGVPPEPGPTAEIVRFVSGLRFDDLSPEIRAVARRHILDSLAVMVAGHLEEGTGLALRRAVAYRGVGEAAVVGTAHRLPAPLAAFVNSFSGHALDYDDTQLATRPESVYGLLTHPSVPVLGAVLAVAETADADGRALLTAFVAGTEAECRISDASNPAHYQRGLHSSGTVGTIGAALGSANLLGFDDEATTRATSIAASQAAGLRENFGTMTKPLHVGRAAQHGLEAALLARDGFTAAAGILEAPRGFFAAMGGTPALELIHGRLGDPWFYLHPGVSIKPHPGGSLTHPAMAVMSDLIARHDVAPEAVEWVRVGTNANMPNALIHHRPWTALEAKFSMEFSMAILLLRRRAGIAEYRDEVVREPDVQMMIGRVSMEVDPVCEAAGYARMLSRIAIGLKDGRELFAEGDLGVGHPANPMSAEVFDAKVRECLETALEPAAAARVIELVDGIEALPSVRDLIVALQPSSGRS